MQSENFDNKIKQAADQHHPDYDGKAWQKMEKLLDRHLPEKGDRRNRVIFFLLFLLLTGAGAWLLVSKPWQPGNQTLTTTTDTPGKSETKPSIGSNKETAGKNSPADKKIDKATIAIPASTDDKKVNPAIIKDAVINKEKRDRNLFTNEKIEGTVKQEKALTAQKNKTEQLSIDIENAEKLKKDKKASANNIIIPSPGNNNNDKLLESNKNKTPADQPVNSDITKNNAAETKKDNAIEQPKTPDKKDVVKKGNNKKANRFFFSFSAAPDISSVGMHNPGKLKLLTGAGVGFTFKDRLTVRTGFYAGRKVYSAGRDDYKPAMTLPNLQYLDNIDADCKVFEIPVGIAYNFSRSEKHRLFAATGLSSYIMKKENYVYLYKYPNGSTYPYTKTINNEYKHFFAVLTLSAGYEHKINRTFSVSAEPYIKLPLAGVGYGKVKLNSVGVLFSVNISPFQPAAKK